MKLVRFLIRAPLFALGVLLALYGLFALTFNDVGGATYVTIAGHRLDAHLAGALSLIFAAVVIAAWSLLGRRRFHISDN